MGLFIVTELLLLTLLLQPTEENAEWKTYTTAEPDNSVRFGEFCLRASDWTSSESPTTQPPTKSSHPTKRATQLPKQSTQPTKQTPKPVGCRCQTREQKPPTRNSQLISVKMWLPSETCSFYEFIESLTDGTTVCVTASSLSEYMRVSLKDGKDFCLDSKDPDYKTKLGKVEIPPIREDSFEKATDGCRCREKEQKRPEEESPVKRISIWPPSDNCSSTEFIETLLDSREVCASASSLSEYPKLSDPPTPVRNVNQMGETRLSGMAGEAGKAGKAGQPAPSARHHVTMISGVSCRYCRSNINWNSIDAKDVQSLEMDMQSTDCPVLVLVTLKAEGNLCMDSTETWFITVLEKLEGQLGKTV